MRRSPERRDAIDGVAMRHEAIFRASAECDERGDGRMRGHTKLRFHGLGVETEHG